MIDKSEIPSNCIIISYKYIWRRQVTDHEEWLILCENLIDMGWRVFLQMSKSSRSKYIYILKKDRCYKIRFSDHAPTEKQKKETGIDWHGRIRKNWGGMTSCQIYKEIIKIDNEIEGRNK